MRRLVDWYHDLSEEAKDTICLVLVAVALLSVVFAVGAKP